MPACRILKRILLLALLALPVACATTPPADSAARPAATASATGTFVVDEAQAVAENNDSVGDPSAQQDTVQPQGAQPAADATDATAPASGEATTAQADAPASLPPTQAELDFAAIYGEPAYDPIADSTLPDPAQLPVSYDPWEPFNRRMHEVNQFIDKRIAEPIAQAYVRAVPRPVRIGVSNFFRNLGQPVAALNSLLQGKPKQAGQALARFTLNTTLGLGGILDPASAIDLPLTSEDFGQTLGVWGWERSRYVELPLFGPRTVRDVVGLFGDAPLSPIRSIEQDSTRVALQGLQLVDVRVQLLAVDSMLEGAPDEYALLRDAWLQRRNYQIHGDRDEEEDLPDYLDEQYNPTVPVDAMPVIPDGG